MPRFALSEPSIGSITRTVSEPSRRPSSSETIDAPVARKRSTIASSAAWSIAVVSSPPSPVPMTGSRSARVGSRSSTASTSATAARQSSQPVSHSGSIEKPGRELRIEERALLRHHVAAPRDLPDVLDPRRAEEERRRRLAAVDRRDRLVAVRRVRHALERERRDDLGVETVAVQQLVAARRDRGQVPAGHHPEG